MPTNAEVAEVFRAIANLLDVLGEPFKPEAYRRAARSIESLTEPIARVAARGELRTIPGVGEAIADKTDELLRTGHLEYYERLLKEVPPGVVEIMRLPSLGPKTARRFWTELGIEGPQELAAAIAAGKLDRVKGFGPKKIEQIRAAIAAAAGGPTGARRPIEDVYALAMRLLAALRATPAVERVEIAGSFRRRQETVGDLDVLATSTAPESVFDRFSGLPDVREVRLRGGTKETVILANGLQVDLRVVEPDAFGAALQYFTGSKDHNVTLRTLARDRGLKINEYGVFRGDARVAGRTEEDVYATLGLAWIPPELRVDRGEIAAAAKGPAPPLVTAEALHGELHLHLPPGADAALVDRVLADAQARSVDYIALVVAGVDAHGDPFRLPAELLRRAGRERAGGPTIVPVAEVGPGPLPATLEEGTAEVRLLRPVGTEVPTEVPAGVHGVVHLGTGLGDPERLARWIGVAGEAGLFVEVGPGSERLDSNAARAALDAGARLAVPRGLGGAEFDPTEPIGIGFARRAGASPEQVANTAKAGPRGPVRRATAR